MPFWNRKKKAGAPSRTRRWLPYLLVAAGGLVLALLARGHQFDAKAPTGLPSAQPVASAQIQLNQLPVAAPVSEAGYSAGAFPHWTVQAGGCDTATVVLKRSGTSVTSRGCTVTGGKWTSPYDGKSMTKPADVVVDELVPLADAWRSGAATWSMAQRQLFANDLADPQLVAVSKTGAGDRADRDPSGWLPDPAFRCVYVRDWIAVKHQWKLTVTEAEKKALDDALQQC